MRRILYIAIINLLLLSMVALPAAAAPADVSVPISMTFDPQGRVYIGEKAGAIRMAPSIAATTSTVVASFTDEVYDFGDNGLSSVAYHDGYIYTTYMMGRVTCGDGRYPENASTSCPSYGQVDRYPVDATNGNLGQRQVVAGGVDGPWCAEYSSHGLDAVFVGPDNGLYVAAGDGAGFDWVDNPRNPEDPCGDDGAFRSQAGDNLMGKIARLNPDTGELSVIAEGLRNPFRQTVHNGEIYTTDTGWYESEEINRIVAGANYGWPCFEGTEVQGLTRPDRSYALDADGSPTASCGNVSNTDPVFSYDRTDRPVSSIAALASFEGRLYFSDFSRSFINSVNADGTDERVVMATRRAVDLAVGPDGNLYGVDPFPGGQDAIFVVREGTPQEASCPADQLGALEPDCAVPVAELTGADSYTPGEAFMVTARTNMAGNNPAGEPFRTPVEADWSATDAAGAAVPFTVSEDRLSATLTPTGETSGEVTVTATFTRGDLSVTDSLTLTRSVDLTPDPGLPFRDIAGTTHLGSILRMVDAGIINGYPDNTYRPSIAVTRGQVASLLYRTGEFPDAGGSFDDVAGTTHETAINALNAAGVLNGYPDNTFRPKAAISREQMASLLARAFDLPPGDASQFVDVSPTGTHAPGIGALVDSGITLGQTPDTYGPRDNVSRGEMASFIDRALAS